jgi:hypothetical protein
VGKIGQAEIREYAPRITAQVAVRGDGHSALQNGFRVLAGYIFGANEGERAVAMTAPVSSAEREDGAVVVQFFMPAEYTMETLPVPLDSKVELVTVPAHTYAVRRFRGFAQGGRMAREQQALLEEIGRSGWRSSGQPLAWYYNPPWTIPFLRRNEAAVRVSPR